MPRSRGASQCTKKRKFGSKTRSLWMEPARNASCICYSYRSNVHLFGTCFMTFPITRIISSLSYPLMCCILWTVMMNPLPDSFSVLTHPNSNIAVDEFRAAQFHHTELSVLFLVGLYLMVFVVGTIGNTLILLWIKNEKSENSLFNPFLVNLCLSDHLVLITCCPLMVYTKVTSLWFLGSFTCTFFHYIQGMFELKDV